MSSQSRKVIVSNLPSKLDKKYLRNFMNRAGEVLKIELVQEIKLKKQTALISYSSSLEAERAIQQLDGQEFQGEAVEVREKTGYILKSFRKSNQVYIKNLPYSVTWQQLKEVFSPFGEILRVDIPKDLNERSKGFGFVQFKTSLQASQAISKMNSAEFNGRRILVKFAQKKHRKLSRSI